MRTAKKWHRIPQEVLVLEIFKNYNCLMIDRPTHYPMILVNWEYIAVNFIIVAIIYVLHQISAQYKNINNTKLDKSIVVYKYKFWQRQSLFGTSTFSEDIGLAASQSCRENRCLLCLAALLLRTRVVARRWMQCFCMFIRSDSCP